MPLLDREEYVEQAFLFRELADRIEQNVATQDLLSLIKEELLATTKLPMAVDFLASELKLVGMLSSAMARLRHYFAPFQTFVVSEAENERGKYDRLVAFRILEREARYRANSPTPQGLFVYQFECISRNRLGYNKGFEAMAGDPMFDESWREWIKVLSRQVGLVDFADMIYVRSEHYLNDLRRRDQDPKLPGKPILFAEKEGRIAWANRGKDPLMLFAALERQLGYPTVPRHEPIDRTPQILPVLLRRVERLETRLKLLEEEQKGGIDLSRFMGPGAAGTT